MILITGCPRSGTSLTVRMLEALGAYTGRPGDVNELREHLPVRQTILKPLLRRFGGDPLAQTHFPAPQSVMPVTGLREAIMDELRPTDERPALYKDPKIAFVWQAFNAAFPAAKWVLVRRERDSNIDSLIRTPFMRVHGDSRDGWGAFLDEHEGRFAAMKAAGLDLIEVSPADVIADPACFAPVAAHCGLVFSEDAVSACIERGKYKDAE